MRLNGLLVEIKENALNAGSAQIVESRLQGIVIGTRGRSKNNIRLQGNNSFNTDVCVIPYIGDVCELRINGCESIIGILTAAFPVLMAPADQLIDAFITGNSKVLFHVEGDNDTPDIGRERYCTALHIRHFDCFIGEGEALAEHDCNRHKHHDSQKKTKCFFHVLSSFQTELEKV